MENKKNIIYSKTYELEGTSSYEDGMFAAMVMMVGAVQEDIKNKDYDMLNSHLEMVVCSAQNLNMFANIELKKQEIK